MSERAAHRTADRSDLPTGQTDLELAKWLAIITMAIDHYGKIAEPALYLETHAIGRVAFPLFAAIIAARLALRPDLTVRYIRNLAPWALISQPAYYLAGKPWYDGNIMFILLFGVVAAHVIGQWRNWPLWQSASILAVVFGLSLLADFGPVGVAMIPALAWAIRRRPRWGIWLVGVFGVAANLYIAWPPLQLIDLTALFASPIFAVSLAARWPIPRLPGLFFYAFYPLHLLALHFWDLYT